MKQRIIIDKKEMTLKSFFLQWEWLLILIFIVMTIINGSLTPYYLNADNLIGATMTFLDKGFIVLPMAFIIILADIDISVASTVALSSVIMGVLYNSGVPMILAMIICLLVGTLCGLVNGLLVARFKELSSMIITLSTMILYRGIAYIILKDQSAGKFPDWFTSIGWGYVGPVPFILIAFIICAVIFTFVLTRTAFGRRVYAIGSNPIASRFTGIQVAKTKIIVFTLAGLMAGVTALFLTSRMGSTRPNVAVGYELDIITMVVLGGISTAGGKGKIYGAIISVFLIGFLRYGLGLFNVNAQIMLIITGLLLIVAVLIPNLKIKKVKFKTFKS